MRLYRLKTTSPGGQPVAFRCTGDGAAEAGDLFVGADGVVRWLSQETQRTLKGEGRYSGREGYEVLVGPSYQTLGGGEG